MLDFELCIPTKIYFGRGQCTRVGEISASRGYRRVLICYGGGSVVRTGLLERVKSSLDAAGVEHDEFGGIQANPTSERCASLARYARERHFDGAQRAGGRETAVAELHCAAVVDASEPHAVRRPADKTAARAKDKNFFFIIFSSIHPYINMYFYVKPLPGCACRYMASV